MAKPFPLTGKCLCGAVKVVVKAPPVRMAQCHCDDCQRITGTGHAANAFFREEDVEVDGKTTGYAKVADSGNVVTRYFCPSCGTRIFHRNSGRPGATNMPIGIFEEKDWFKPDFVLYAVKRPAWDSSADDVPEYPGMPDQPIFPRK